jgi:hypothetical protein
MTIEIKRVLKYPYETFLESAPVDLLAGDNKVAEYTTFEPYILSINGVSFNPVDGISFSIDADGMTNKVYIANLISTKGLDYEEAVKLPVTKIATMKFTTSSAVSGYQWRYRLTVLKPTAALKLQLGLPLTARDRDLISKFNIDKALKVSTPEPLNPYAGIEEWRTVAVKLTASGTVVNVLPPKNKKVILAGIAATRPSAPASAYLNVNRDNVDKTLYLDLYNLPSLSHEAVVRIVSLDKLLVTLDVKTSGTYYVRLTYGIGSITLREKVEWGLPLTDAERAEAEALDLFDKVEAGVA